MKIETFFLGSWLAVAYNLPTALCSEIMYGGTGQLLHCSDTETIHGVANQIIFFGQTALQCEGSSFNNRAGTNHYSNAGQFARCPEGSVGYGMCASGNLNSFPLTFKTCRYSGVDYNHGMKCGTLKSDVVQFSTEGTSTKSCRSGFCECDPGWYVTGFCGAGDKVCHSNYDSTAYNTIIECKRIVCKAGRDQFNSCHLCAPGYYSGFAGQGCQQCGPGKYQDQTGQASCKDCPEGFSFSGSGATGCEPCAAGTKSEKPGSTKCQPCDPGFFSRPEATRCERCSAGTYSYPGFGQCKDCPAGTTSKTDNSGCNDIDECKGTHGCPKHSACVNKILNENSSGRGFDCQCNPGFAIAGSNGMSTIGNTDINCEAVPIQLDVIAVSYQSIQFKIRASNVPLLSSYDVSVSVKDDSEKTIYTKNTNEIQQGVTIADLDPGTSYLVSLYAGGEAEAQGATPVTGTYASTTCECDLGGTDGPGSFKVMQANGFVTFKFKDKSRCEEGFSLTRTGPDQIPNVFTSTYFYASSTVCDGILDPGSQTVDNLLLARLPVGVGQKYCIKAVAPGSRYSSVETCEIHSTAWEASLDGIAQLAPHAGSIPVQDVEVSWKLMSSNGTVILSGFQTTDRSGKYFIELKSSDPDLFTTAEGKNRDVELRIKFSKTTLTSHTFVCEDGESICSGDRYTSVFLRHLDFNVKHSAVDTSTVPITGKVLIAETGRAIDANDPENFEVLANTECPIIGAEVCLQIQNLRVQAGERICVQTNSEGEWSLGAPLGTRVKVEVDYNNHTFVLFQEDYEVPNERDGFKINSETAYENFVFKDVENAPLQTSVVGGLCDRLLGDAEVIVTLPSCPYWKGKLYSQAAIKAEHYVLAQEISVSVRIDGRFDIEMDSQTIDLRNLVDEENVESQATINNAEMEQILKEDEGQLDVLRFQWNGTTVLSVTSSGNQVTENCAAESENGESLHVLYAYRTFDLTVKVEQEFGGDIANCDHIPDDTKVFIQSQVGLSETNPSDKNFIKTEGLEENVVAEYTKCSNQDEENDECVYPACCLLDIDHTELSDGTKTNAQVSEQLRAGPPLIADPFLKVIIIQVGDVQHKANVLVIGDYDDGVPDRFPLPAMDPIMILRDPPGSSSYAYYENIRTTTSVEVKGIEGYLGFHLGLLPGSGVEDDSSTCIGLGAAFCNKVFKLKAKADNFFANDSKWAVKHKIDTDAVSFVTTWSYQTSAEPDGAGHSSDIFVVPSISLLLHPVIEISFDAVTCEGSSEPKIKFSAESDRQENSLSFLSLDGVEEMLQRLHETKSTLQKMSQDPEEPPTNQAAAHRILPTVTQALRNWERILNDYELTNKFDASANIINPSQWLDEFSEKCSRACFGTVLYPWQMHLIPMECLESCKTLIPDSHWSSLIPSDLSDEVDREIGLDEWEDVKLVSFSGGGAEFQYRLDRSSSKDAERMIGGHDDNSEQDYSAGQNLEFELNVWKIETDTLLELHPGGSEVRTHFKHDTSADDSTMGFVLSDPDVGDRFDVKIGIDPRYGSFVFQTVGGLSKCSYEEGTDQREKPGLQLLAPPVGEILPDNAAVFQVQLQNLGPTSNEYDLSMERRDNTHGLAVYASGSPLALNQHYEEMDPTEAVETTISIFRGPVLYEYDPIHLRLQSQCDDDAVATLELHTHIRASDGKKVIRFARPCPQLRLEGVLGTGTVVINSAIDRKVPLVIQNVERNGRGSLADMASNVDDTLKEVQLLYRKVGSRTWTRARGPDPSNPTERIDMDLTSSDEDDYGFVTDEWNTDQLIDGEYEVMVRSSCPKGPKEFRYADTEVSILRLDTISPSPFAFPSETDTYHVGEPMIFEFDEELDCIHPFSFVLEASVVGVDRDFAMNNMIVVCEDRMIGIQFDSSKVNLEELAGQTAIITLSSVRDTSGNVAPKTKATVNFSGASGAEKQPQMRRLNSVPSIKVFQKPNATSVVLAPSKLDDVYEELAGMKRKLDNLEKMEGKLESLETMEEKLSRMEAVLESMQALMHGLLEEKIASAAQGSAEDETWRGVRG